MTLESLTHSCGLLKSIPLMSQHGSSANKQLRLLVASGFVQLLKLNDAASLTDYAHEFEIGIKAGLSDADQSVREASRKAFQVYQTKFEARVSAFEATLPAKVIKYLEADGKTPIEMMHRPKLVAPPTVNQVPSKPTSGGIHARPSRVNIGDFTQQQPPQRTARLGEPVRVQMDVAPTAVAKEPQTRTARLGLPSKTTGFFDNSRDLPRKLDLSSLSAETPGSKKGISGLPQRVIVGEEFKKPVERPPASSRKFVSMRQDAAAELPEEIFSASQATQNTIDEAKKMSAEIQLPARPKPVTSMSLTQEKIQIIVPSQLPEEAETKIQISIERELNALLAGTKKSDWLTRQKSFEGLDESLRDGKLADQEVLRPKVFDSFLESLSDSHYRVNRAGMDIWMWLFENDTLNISNYYSSLLPRLIQIHEDPSMKSKAGLRESSATLISGIQSRLSSSQWVVELFNVLNLHDYFKNTRTRNGVLTLISKAPIHFTKLSSFKMSLARIAPCVPDADRSTTLVTIRKILGVIHGISSTMFFDALSYLNARDRQLIRDVVSKDIKNYAQLEDRAINARRLQRHAAASSTAQQETPNLAPVDSIKPNEATIVAEKKEDSIEAPAEQVIPVEIRPATEQLDVSVEAEITDHVENKVQETMIEHEDEMVSETTTENSAEEVSVSDILSAAVPNRKDAGLVRISEPGKEEAVDVGVEIGLGSERCPTLVDLDKKAEITNEIPQGLESLPIDTVSGQELVDQEAEMEQSLPNESDTAVVSAEDLDLTRQDIEHEDVKVEDLAQKQLVEDVARVSESVTISNQLSTETAKVPCDFMDNIVRDIVDAALDEVQVNDPLDQLRTCTLDTARDLVAAGFVSALPDDLALDSIHIIMMRFEEQLEARYLFTFLLTLARSCFFVDIKPYLYGLVDNAEKSVTIDVTLQSIENKVSPGLPLFIANTLFRKHDVSDILDRDITATLLRFFVSSLTSSDPTIVLAARECLVGLSKQATGIDGYRSLLLACLNEIDGAPGRIAKTLLNNRFACEDGLHMDVV